MNQIDTGGFVHEVGPVLAALLAVSPETSAAIASRGAVKRRSEFEVQGVPVLVVASLTSIDIRVTVARDLVVGVILEPEPELSGTELSYCGANGDLSDAMVEIGERSGTMRDVLEQAPHARMPAFLEPFADQPLVDMNEDLGHPDGDVVILQFPAG